MLKIILCIVVVYIVIVQILAHNHYRFCKKDKECRNIACVKGHKCPFNSLYQDAK